MPNSRAAFITTRPADQGGTYGSSLYLVTAHWVLRCSGNSNGRTPETFIRRRGVRYDTGGGNFVDDPVVGSHPVEGGHTGNAITSIIAVGDNLDLPNAAPAAWVSNNGVPWATAVQEIDDAREYAERTQEPRASRQVGHPPFTVD